MKLFLKEQATPEPPVGPPVVASLEAPTEPKPPHWPVLLNLGLVIIFLLALAVQLGRGKLWLVGETGVWLLFLDALLVTILRPVLQDPLSFRRQLAGQAVRFYRRLSPYGLVVAFLTLAGLWLR